MSKAGDFKKFVQKKKNSVIKEEIRKEKKEWKKELTVRRFQKKRIGKRGAASPTGAASSSRWPASKDASER